MGWPSYSCPRPPWYAIAADGLVQPWCTRNIQGPRSYFTEAGGWCFEFFSSRGVCLLTGRRMLVVARTAVEGSPNCKKKKGGRCQMESRSAIRGKAVDALLRDPVQSEALSAPPSLTRRRVEDVGRQESQKMAMGKEGAKNKGPV